jgi:starch synthase
VWPQPRTILQNIEDRALAKELGIDHRVFYATSVISRDFIPYLLAACDIYAAPSRLEGFGMPQIEAGACGKPVISINAMGMLDTLVQGKTALLAQVAQRITVSEVTLGEAAGLKPGTKIKFDVPRTVDYRADVNDIRDSLLKLLSNPELRSQMGMAGRQRVVENFDYRVVAQKFVKFINEKVLTYS